MRFRRERSIQYLRPILISIFVCSSEFIPNQRKTCLNGKNLKPRFLDTHSQLTYSPMLHSTVGLGSRVGTIVALSQRQASPRQIRYKHKLRRHLCPNKLKKEAMGNTYGPVCLCGCRSSEHRGRPQERVQGQNQGFLKERDQRSAILEGPSC